MLNISKKTKFPEHYYDVYHLKKSDIGKYLNTWFEGVIAFDKKKGFLVADRMWTLKKVDDETACHLYNRKYNPIGIWISCPTGADFKKNEKGVELYQMKSMICSVDDSSYGIWFDNKTIDELKAIRLKIMEYVDSKKIINGEEFLEYNLTLGADKESIDYN